MSNLPITPESSSSSPLSIRQKKTGTSKPRYLLWGVLLNTAVWALAFLYLKAAPRSYTSQWGVVVVGSNPGIDVTLPERGRTAPNPFSERPWIFQDPRSAYSYLATNPALIETAAKSLDIPVNDFGKPVVNIDKESAVIAFEMRGKTPEQAQQKAQVLYETMRGQVNRLREAQLAEDAKETQQTLQDASRRLDEAKRKLSQYQSRSLLQAPDQIKQLSTNLEDLYRQKAELASQDQGLRNRLQQLGRDAKVSSQQAGAAYALTADEVYKQQFVEYGRLTAEYQNVAAQLGPEHPVVLEKKSAATGAAAALQQRGSLVLGRSVTLNELVQMAPAGVDPGVAETRKVLFPDMTTSRAKQQETAATLQELDRQIQGLKARLQTLSQESIVTDSIRRDIQISEAIFTSSLAKVDGQRNIDSIYPPMRLVAQPNLPREATSPNLQLALLGGVAGTVLVTTGLLLAWYEKRRPKAESVLFDARS
ncbi:hypothetical protein ACQ4M3_39220 [Leptolyngbya sp. AN03gr2]|uniref:hypothetical protein n=1 Tax=unclassified Leptolyngbya TaxID=2650499 RepID=UPI003D31F78B